MQKELILGSLRTPAALVPIETVSMKDIAAAINPTKVRLVNFVTPTGHTNQYLHLVTKDDSYLAIKISTKCNLESSDDAGKAAELIKGFTIYTGESDNARWYTFGPVPTERKVVELNFADLMKGGALTAALAG